MVNLQLLTRLSNPIGQPTVTLASLSDYRDKARKRLPPFLFEYIDGGSFNETTLRWNETDLADIRLKQRVLRDVSNIDLSTNFFGTNYRLPIGLAPVGLAGMNARRGEVQAVKAAEASSVPFCLSTVSVCPISEVAAASTAPIWFQLYMIRDRAFMIDLLQLASKAGVEVLVLTVDLPLPGTRYRDYRSGLAGSDGFLGEVRRLWQAAMHPQWAWDVGLWGRPHHLGNVAPVLKGNTGLEDFMAWMANNFDASLTWNDLDFIRTHWKGKIIIKGILDPGDAREALAQGVDGIVVSNHGGRQLDGAPSSASALPSIAEIAKGKCQIFADGGVRSGLDVVKLLALGCDGVLLGRAWAYALAGAGQQGVSHMLSLIENEMKVAMALTGCTQITDISREILV